jgi:hypothetical protein
MQPGAHGWFDMANIMRRRTLPLPPVLCERHLLRPREEMPDPRAMQGLSAAFADGFTFAGYL